MRLLRHKLMSKTAWDQTHDNSGGPRQCLVPEPFIWGPWRYRRIPLVWDELSKPRVKRPLTLALRVLNQQSIGGWRGQAPGKCHTHLGCSWWWPGGKTKFSDVKGSWKSRFFCEIHDFKMLAYISLNILWQPRKIHLWVRRGPQAAIGYCCMSLGRHVVQAVGERVNLHPG